MIETTKPVFLIISNFTIVIAGIVGFWFIKVGLGFGRGTQVPGDGIFGLLILLFGFSLTVFFLFIALLRKELPIIGYFIPLLISVLMFCYLHFNRN